MLALLATLTVGQYGGYATGYGYGHVTAHNHYAGCGHSYYGQPAFTADPTYYAGVVAQYVRKQAEAQAKVQAAADLTAKLERLTQSVSALDQRIAAATAPPGATYTTTPPVSQTPIQSPAASASAISPARQQLLTLLGRDCKGCHTTPASAGGGFAILNPDGSAAFDSVGLKRIEAAIATDFMPPGRPYDSDRKAVVAQAAIEDARNFLRQVKGPK
jgi:hypothetical protein